MDAAQLIIEGKGYLGIEFGSTRIKAVLVDKSGNVLASGGHSWENRYEDGVWTYSLNDIWDGLQDCYKDLKENVKKEYGVTLKHLDAIGFSAMMHGYLAFDENDTILVPFRTWRNTITEEAASKLTAEFNYNIPQRWSIAHLYQAILNGEEHVPYVDFFTTLAGYVHWRLTGRKVLGVGDASGMFPIDIHTGDYDQTSESSPDHNPRCECQSGTFPMHHRLQVPFFRSVSNYCLKQSHPVLSFLQSYNFQAEDFSGLLSLLYPL